MTPLLTTEAEKLKAEIDAALDPLEPRELLDILRYINENHWTTARKEDEEDAEV